ncbi:hypothetical protein [Acinetobacter sp. YH12218]|uniref:hypothetical protein n=1 Tax=Acinetobacter sp. YH12218 TaxID=2601152 RepID=UPI0015D11001|nr:hypothetical protein [Acinetobacter sp. YH12218]
MSNIKQPAPFYSLKETTEYFNNKYNQCTFSDSYLLKQLLAFNIPAHIYSFGLNPYGSEFFFKKDLLRRTDPDWSEWVDKRDSILPDFVEFLHNESCKTGLFLELRHQDLVQVCMQNQVITYAFKDVIPFDYITISSSLREVIDDMWKATSNYYKNKKPDALIQKEIDNMKELFDNFVSVEEFISTTDMQEISSKSKRQYLNVKPEIIVVDEIIGHLKDFCFLKIIPEDVFILSKNLALLEKYLIGEEVYVQSQKPLIKITQSPKGKSKDKEMAQLAAKTLANYLWNQDTDNKIKIKEMAITIHAELNQTEHRNQLPDQSVSLKKWIEDIAPEYAREAGRPKEI